MMEDGREFFLEEAKELLVTLESSLLKLEKKPDAISVIHDIFRILHTIKGSGAMFGFDALSRFTHQIENLFDDMRKGAVPISQDAVAVGLRSADCIRILLDDDNASTECDALLDDIARIRRGSAKAATPREKPGPSGSGPTDYEIRIVPDADILHRGIKFETIFSNLQRLGEYACVADISRIPEIADIDPEKTYLSWKIALATERPKDDIEQTLEFIGEFSECRVTSTRDGAVPGTAGLARQKEGNPDDEQARPPQSESAAGAQSERNRNAALPSLPVMREHRNDPGLIRVRREKLDLLFNTIGELAILHAQLARESRDSGSQAVMAISEQLDRLTKTLMDSTMRMRMVPIEESFAGIQRVVHDTAKRLGKDVRLEVIGANTEIDKTIMEALKDPLIHIIRNSIDHGIEQPSVRLLRNKPPTGTITISACQIGTSVQIVISDDGGGLDIEKIRKRAIEKNLIDAQETDVGAITQVIFEPGFSTADKATSLSGRGVGMDIVRASIDKLQGDIAIASEGGKGMTITMTVPLTLMIADGLLVSVGGIAYVLTLNLVQECLLFDNCVSDGIVQHEVITWHEHIYPVIDLHEYLCGSPAANDSDTRAILTTVEGNDVALVVDRIEAKQQVVIKPFASDLDQIPLVSGATILADGSVALILNTSEIAKRRIPAYRTA